MTIEQTANLLVAAAAVLFPAIVAWIGHMYTAALKDRERKATYIAMAVEILKQSPKKGDENLRRWAIEIVNRYSDVKMSDDLRNDLVSRQALRREAVDRFATYLGNVSDKEKRQLQERVTQANFAALQQALPQIEVSVSGTKRSLAELGFYQGPIDNELSPPFFDAVAAFQKDAGLDAVDGIVGEETFEKLRAHVSAK